MKWISRTCVVSVVANQDVAVQNWWHFFSQPASNIHGMCKLSVSHHRTISSSPMSWLSKNLSVALLEHYVFLKLDAFYEEFIFFLIFCYKINSEVSFYALSVCETVYENTKPATVSFDLCNDTSVFCMDDVFELLSKLNVYVQGVRLIPVGFKTKLNILFDIAVVWKRKRGNEGGSRLHFSKIFLSIHREVLWTQWQSAEEHFKWIQRLFSCQAFNTLNIWKSQDGCNTLLVTT